MKIVLLVPSIIAVTIQAVHSASFVVPNEHESVEGNQDNFAPFGLVGTDISMRYQQVYDASQFSSIPDGAWITSISFRVDALFGSGFSATLTNIQINLSTTAKPVDSLSPVFSANVGSDDRIVFGPGPLTIASGFFHNGSPQQFEVGILLATPFLYRPALGNLLMDVRNYQGLPFTAVSTFDAQNSTGDAVSRMYGDSVDSMSAAYVDSLGLITLFGVTPVPEPCSLSVALAGTIFFSLFHYRMREMNTADTELPFSKSI